jgi:hypothetical protein
MKHQAFKNIVALQIILCEKFTVNKETFCSLAMDQTLFKKVYMLFTSMLSSKNTSANIFI